MWTLVFLYFSLIQYTVIINNVEASGCFITLNSLKTDQPLILNTSLKSGNWVFLQPNSNGQIRFGIGDTFLLSCPGSFISQPDKSVVFSSVELRCTASGFMSNFEVFDIDKTTCTNQIVEKFSKCGNTHYKIYIGYKVHDGRNIYLLEICFDYEKKNTFYSAYILSQYIGGCVTNFPRENFNAQLFGIPQDVVDDLYKQVNQQKNINKLLGLPATSEKYIVPKNNYYLAKGHLTAKCDFTFGSQQKLTFYYINTAPQWQTMNLGNWKTLETAIRSFAQSQKKDFFVYTGTYGVATLPNSAGIHTGLYLHVSLGVKEMPIPALFWKILYDFDKKTGVAFLVINNPYQPSYVPICPNTCQGNTPIPLNWKPNDQKLGFAYCCDLSEFVRVVRITLP